MMGSGTPRMGSGTPPMQRDNHVVFSSSSMPMIGSGTPMCRKFARALSVGAKGDDVKDLQEMLHERGYLSASSTGYFGMVTKAAVAKFQKDGGLNPSGFFGDLSRKHHEKRCDEGMGRDDDRGMGSTTPPMMGGDDHKWNGSSTMPVPCMTSASASGCEHSRAFHPMMGTGTPQSLCTTKFDPLTGKHCKKDSDDDHFWSTSTPPVMLPPATTTATTTTI